MLQRGTPKLGKEDVYKRQTFTPHVDCGDHVIIINCAEAVLTGGKADKKYYYHHTGYICLLYTSRCV